MSTVHAGGSRGVMGRVTEQLICLAEVVKISAKSRASIYRAMDAGEFPRSIRTGSNSVRWLSSEVSAWVEARIAERDSKEQS